MILEDESGCGAHYVYKYTWWFGDTVVHVADPPRDTGHEGVFVFTDNNANRKLPCTSTFDINIKTQSHNLEDSIARRYTETEWRAHTHANRE